MHLFLTLGQFAIIMFRAVAIIWISSSIANAVNVTHPTTEGHKPASRNDSPATHRSLHSLFVFPQLSIPLLSFPSSPSLSSYPSPPSPSFPSSVITTKSPAQPSSQPTASPSSKPTTLSSAQPTTEMPSIATPAVPIAIPTVSPAAVASYMPASISTALLSAGPPPSVVSFTVDIRIGRYSNCSELGDRDKHILSAAVARSGDISDTHVTFEQCSLVTDEPPVELSSPLPEFRRLVGDGTQDLLLRMRLSIPVLVPSVATGNTSEAWVLHNLSDVIYTRTTARVVAAARSGALLDTLLGLYVQSSEISPHVTTSRMELIQPPSPYAQPSLSPTAPSRDRNKEEVESPHGRQEARFAVSEEAVAGTVLGIIIAAGLLCLLIVYMRRRGYLTNGLRSSSKSRRQVQDEGAAGTSGKGFGLDYVNTAGYVGLAQMGKHREMFGLKEPTGAQTGRRSLKIKNFDGSSSEFSVRTPTPKNNHHINTTISEEEAGFRVDMGCCCVDSWGAIATSCCSPKDQEQKIVPLPAMVPNPLGSPFLMSGAVDPPAD
jgi:hypothetical protein